MFLLTWHGTVVCLRPAGGLVQVRLPLADASAAPLEIEIADVRSQETRCAHPALGEITVRPAPSGQGVCLARAQRYLCAEQALAKIAFDRDGAREWESFFPLTPADLAGLERLLGHRWIVRSSRRVLRTGDIGLEEGFTLKLGAERLGLAWCLPLRATPETLGLGPVESGRELVQAMPRSSALLETALWPVRARRVAEILTLATHRHMAGSEPAQAIFEEDVAFLMERGGAPGLESLMEQVQQRLRPAPSPAVPGASPGARPGGAPASANAAAQPVVALGTACITACLLRREGLLGPPLPFDWLGTTPAMVRHCLETDFAMLLDRSQYRSLTGAAQPGEPPDGCAHDFYAREHGIGRVFNHNDPTREADYRYTVACVERLRALLAANDPVLFVQVREASPQARQEFEATAALLDGLTRHASLVQVAVGPPDRRLAMPLVSVSVRQGAHVLYRMQPASQVGGEGFVAEADNACLAGLIAAHAGRPATSLVVVPGDRAALQVAMDRFGRARPPGPAPQDEAGRLGWFDQGNVALLRFLEVVGLPRRTKFSTYDRTKIGRHLTSEAAIVHVSAQQAVMRFDVHARNPWVLMGRSLPLVYLLDAMLVAGPPPDLRFFAEFGDCAHEPRSVAYCSSAPDTCLLPDSDFVVTGGYDDVRRQVQANPPAWGARSSTVFWRGATTGIRRHPPPAEGEADDFTWLPRLHLCRHARESPLARHYDVGVSNIVQIDDPHLARRVKASGLCRPAVPRTAFLGHKAILVIDGNSNAWSALFCALLTGACVLKVESPRGFRQWYYDTLTPGVHFLPVAADLSDLDAQVEWLLSHDAAAQAIGAAGQALARSMNFERVMEDAALRLRRWLMP